MYFYMILYCLHSIFIMQYTIIMRYKQKKQFILSGMKRTLRKAVIANLKYYREKAGISQQKLSLELGKSINYINGIENGSGFPAIEVIEDISEILTINPMLLFDRQGCPENIKRFDREQFVNDVTEGLYGRLKEDIGKEVREVLGKPGQTYYKKS